MEKENPSPETGTVLHSLAMNMEKWRAQIDEIDRELVALLNRRATCVHEIARLKQSAGLPVYVPEREAQVHANIQAANTGPLDGEAIERLFNYIIEESRRLEHILIDSSRESSKS